MSLMLTHIVQPMIGSHLNWSCHCKRAGNCLEHRFFINCVFFMERFFFFGFTASCHWLEWIHNSQHKAFRLPEVDGTSSSVLEGYCYFAKMFYKIVFDVLQKEEEENSADSGTKRKAITQGKKSLFLLFKVDNVNGYSPKISMFCAQGCKVRLASMRE